jgi:hypothetical protein
MVFKRHNFFKYLFRFSSLLVLFLIFLPAATSLAEDDGSSFAGNPVMADNSLVPYGRVIFQINGQLPRQIYIVGQTHRSALTRESRPDVIRVQAQIYRIGEWLIREQKVGMLLPEGFFQRPPGKDSAPALIESKTSQLDNRSLEAMLGDTRRFVNADLLLNNSYHVSLRQVENERLYRDAYQLLREASRNGNLTARARLEDLQVERTAFMLQNIPDVVEEAFTAGRIENCKAMFTIGLGHVREIINFLQNGFLRVPVNSDLRQERIKSARLKLLERGYGVTVIIPKAVVENEQLLALARLEVR